MMSRNARSRCVFEAAPRNPTYSQVIEMVKIAENDLEIELSHKRDRLKHQISHETLRYGQEIHEKYEELHALDQRKQADNLDMLRIEQELYRQKYVEQKQLHQHFLSSEELRIDLSKKLVNECHRSHIEQVKFQHQLNDSLIQAENAEIREARRLQLEQLRKEEEALRAVKLQKNWNARQEHQIELARKNDRMKAKLAEEEIERESMQKKDETMKKMMEDMQIAKLKEVQEQRGFLQRQIEHRKLNEDYARQKRIQYEKSVAELAKQQLINEKKTIEQAKMIQNSENTSFIEYLQRLKVDKMGSEVEDVDLMQLSFINEEMKADAEIKKHQKKRQLNAILQEEFLKKSNEKHNGKVKDRQREVYELKESQRQNALYEQMMAERKAQQRVQFQQELDRQIEFKNMEIAYGIDQDTRFCRNIHKLDEASNTLTQRLLKDGIDSVVPKHPFYRCLKRNDD